MNSGVNELLLAQETQHPDLSLIVILNLPDDTGHRVIRNVAPDDR
jgi:hypothetical protein